MGSGCLLSPHTSSQPFAEGTRRCPRRSTQKMAPRTWPRDKGFVSETSSRWLTFKISRPAKVGVSVLGHLCSQSSFLVRYYRDWLRAGWAASATAWLASGVVSICLNPNLQDGAGAPRDPSTCRSGLIWTCTYTRTRVARNEVTLPRVPPTERRCKIEGRRDKYQMHGHFRIYTSPMQG